MDSAQFSQQIEAAYRAALQGADALTADAKRLQAEAQGELAAAREARREAELAGERLVREAGEAAREKLAESARRELLRGLVRRHLEAGKAAGEIVEWLGVTPEFVEEIARLQRPSRSSPFAADAPIPNLPRHARVGTTQAGRSGTVWFECEGAKLDLWWEFAGGDALAIVEFPTPGQWPGRTGLPLEQRAAVAEFIGRDLVSRQTPGGSFTVGDDVLTLYSSRS